MAAISSIITACESGEQISPAHLKKRNCPAIAKRPSCSRPPRTTRHDRLRLTMSRPAGSEPLRADDHIIGPDSAPVTVVAYCDFECPYCGRAFHRVRRL